MGEVAERTEARNVGRATADGLRLAQSNQDMSEGQHLFAQKSERPAASALDFGTAADLYGHGADGRWHFENPRANGNDIAGKLKEWVWNDLPNLPRDTVNGAWPLAEQVAIKANDVSQRHFSNVDGWQDLDLKACDKAFEAFPKLAQYQLPRDVIAGLMLNEIRHRDLKDFGEDWSVEHFGTVRNFDGSENTGASIGPAQIQIGTIRELARKYPQLAELKEPVKAALKPETAPLFVAAYLTEHLTTLEQHNLNSPKDRVSIDLASLLYSYNPDVAVRNETPNPGPNDYRAYTAAEKVENSITHEKAASAANWHSVWFATNNTVTEKSEVVQNMLDGIAAIEVYRQRSGR